VDFLLPLQKSSARADDTARPSRSTQGRMQQKISLRGAGGGGGGLSKNSSTQNNGELFYLVVS
jgi:hypothetical protein